MYKPGLSLVKSLGMLVWVLLALWGFVGVGGLDAWASPPATLRVAVVRPPQTIDPVRLGSIFTSRLSAQIFEPLLTYDHLKRPLALQPLLVTTLPTVSKDGKVYTFTLKRGIFFHDSPCFPKGKGRELVAKDVLYSIKRMTHPALRTTGKWIYRSDVVGFQQFAQMMKLRYWQRQTLDFSLPMKGLRQLDRYRFQIIVKKRSRQFLHLLTNQATAVVPQEVAECQRAFAFRRYPAGTGPFRLKRWGSDRVVLVKNPRYKHARYPTSFSVQDLKREFYKDAGKSLPLVDRLEVRWGSHWGVWLYFWRNHIDYIILNTVTWDLVFGKDGQLLQNYKKLGYYQHTNSLLDFIYTGFNMKDPVVGGKSQRALFLRKAIAHTIDLNEINRLFYNNRAQVYRGMIPPGLQGFLGDRPKPDLKLARSYLAKAGYPKGKGLPTLVLSTSHSQQVREREKVWKRQLAQIGVKIRFELSTFAQLTKKLRAGRVQMFSLAWASDYPDAENNLMLFYGPNKAPGSNSWNYDNPAYNRLYEKIKGMQDSPARARLYRRMNQMVTEDAVFVGSMARTRTYLAHSRLRNFKPDEAIAGFWKYLRVIPPPSIHTTSLPLWGNKVVRWIQP